MYLTAVFVILHFNLIQGDFELTLLHTNDVHAHVEQTNVQAGVCSPSEVKNNQCYGGVARRQTVIKAIRRNHDNVILLDAGDQFQGTSWFTFYKGLEAAYFMNRLDYDAMTLGNHEFDNGVSGLLVPFLQQTRFPVVSCNINTSRVPALSARVKDYTVLNVAGELIGVIGYITQETSFLVSPDGIADIAFLDPIPCIQAAVDELHDQGINKIVALGHSGFAYSKIVARSVRGLDIVVDGHTNTFLYNGPPPSVEKPKGPYPVVVNNKMGGKTLVYQAYAYGKYLGYSRITFNDTGDVVDWSGNPILLDGKFNEDPSVLADVIEWKKPLIHLSEDIIGQSYVYLEGGHTCEEFECNFGNLITDAILYAVQKGPTADGWTNVSVAFINGGSIRAPMLPGSISANDLETTIPILNRLQVVSIKGFILRQVLEHSVTSSTSTQGHFLQMSGMHVSYDMCQTDGSRVSNITVVCTACEVPRYTGVEDSAIYNVLTSTYLTSGGDGYSVLRDNILNTYEIEFLLNAIVKESIKKNSPIIQGNEGRITFLRTMKECTFAD